MECNTVPVATAWDRKLDIDKFGAEGTEALVNFGNLRCVVCLELARYPNSTNCCQATICALCARKLLGEPKNAAGARAALGSVPCPTCRQKKGFTSDGTKVRMWNELPVKCYYFESGCAWKGQRRDWVKHVTETCDQRPVQCPHFHAVEHDVRGTAAAMREHTQVCPRRPWTCPDCKLVRTAAEEKKHRESLCPRRPVECDLCHTEYPRGDDHQRVCPYTYCPLRCGVVMLVPEDTDDSRLRWTEHLRNTEKHPQLASETARFLGQLMQVAKVDEKALDDKTNEIAALKAQLAEYEGKTGKKRPQRDGKDTKAEDKEEEERPGKRARTGGDAADPHHVAGMCISSNCPRHA